MIRGWRQVLPNKYVVVFFAVVYLLTYRLDQLFVRLGAPIPVEVAWTRLIVLLFAAALYGYWRVRCFHPCYNGLYRAWLAISPWTFGKALPLGPVHLVWVDFVVVGVLTLVGWSNGFFHVAWPAVTFLGIYLIFLALALTFGAGEFGLVLVTLFLAPFVVYPHRSPMVALAILMGFYILLHIGLRRELREFPWNTGYWKSDPVEGLRKGAIGGGLAGWPLGALRRESSPLGTRLEVSVLAVGAAILVAWWLHVIRWFVEKPYDGGFLWLIMLALVFARLVVYLYPGYLPPIGFFGRVFTFRWIIPGYDKVFIGPICIFVFCVATVGACGEMGLSDVWTFELSFFVMVVTALLMPPSLRSWRLTGRHRMKKPAKTGRQAAASGGGLMLFVEAMRYRRSDR